MIPYGKHSISKDDIQAVSDVLESDWITQGPIAPQFEAAVSEYCKTKYSVATNSATSALHIACLALGVHKDDSVWTSPISFVASANCALYCGASIDFVDVNKHSGLICPTLLREKLEAAKLERNLPKVLIAVHLAGHSCDMEEIHKLSKEYQFSIIEDASHATGGSYNNHKIGSCKYSDITVFSFHPVKIITSGEGGMALTNSKALADKMASYRSHGITKSPGELLKPDAEPWHYEQHNLGFNYRLSDIHAALGLSQLKQLDTFVNQRNSLATIYNDAFDNLGIDYVVPSENCSSAYHLYIIRLTNEELRLQTYNYLKTAGIGANVHYTPIHTQPYYQKFGFVSSDFPNAMKFYESILSIPLYPTLPADRQAYVIGAVSDSLKMSR